MITYETPRAQTQINIATSLKEMYERELYYWNKTMKTFV